jgi:hypothetical protein
MAESKSESKFMSAVRRFFGPAGYESETTQFMRDFFEKHPEEVVSQREGRGIWWDKDARERTAPSEARNPPKSGGAEYTFKA